MREDPSATVTSSSHWNRRPFPAARRPRRSLRSLFGAISDWIRISSWPSASSSGSVPITLTAAALAKRIRPRSSVRISPGAASSSIPRRRPSRSFEPSKVAVVDFGHARDEQRDRDHRKDGSHLRGHPDPRRGDEARIHQCGEPRRVAGDERGVGGEREHERSGGGRHPAREHREQDQQRQGSECEQRLHEHLLVGHDEMMGEPDARDACEDRHDRPASLAVAGVASSPRLVAQHRHGEGGGGVAADESPDRGGDRRSESDRDRRCPARGGGRRRPARGRRRG